MDGSVNRVSLFASQIMTDGWFHLSCIHSLYSAASSLLFNFLTHLFHEGPPYQIGNSSWIINPSSSAILYHSSGGKPMQFLKEFQYISVLNFLCILRTQS